MALRPALAEFGQPASSQTVVRPCSRTMSRVSDTTPPADSFDAQPVRPLADAGESGAIGFFGMTRAGRRAIAHVENGDQGGLGQRDA